MRKLPTAVRKIVETYQLQTDVVGIVWCGSQPQGRADRWSDVDLYILTRLQPDYSRRLITAHEPLIDIICDSVKTAKRALQSESTSVRRNFSHYLTYGQAVFSRGQSLGRLLRRAKHNLVVPTRMTRAEKIMHQYSLADFLGEMERFASHSQVYPFELNRQLFLNNATEFFLKIRGGFFQPPSQMSAYLKRLSRPIGTMLIRAQSAKTLPQQLRTARNVHRRLTTLVGGSLRGDIRIKA